MNVAPAETVTIDLDVAVRARGFRDHDCQRVHICSEFHMVVVSGVGILRCRKEKKNQKEPCTISYTMSKVRKK